MNILIFNKRIRIVKFITLIFLISLFPKCSYIKYRDVVFLYQQKILPEGDLFQVECLEKDYLKIILKEKGTNKLIPLIQISSRLLEEHFTIPHREIFIRAPIVLEFSPLSRRCAFFKGQDKSYLYSYLYVVDFKDKNVKKFNISRGHLNKIWFLSEDEIIININSQIYLLEINSGKLRNISPLANEKYVISDVSAPKREIMFYNNKMKLCFVKINKEDKIREEIVKEIPLNFTESSYVVCYSPDGNKLLLKDIKTIKSYLFNMVNNKLKEIPGNLNKFVFEGWYNDDKIIFSKMIKCRKDEFFKKEIYLFDIENSELLYYSMEDVFKDSSTCSLSLIKQK